MKQLDIIYIKSKLLIYSGVAVPPLHEGGDIRATAPGVIQPNHARIACRNRRELHRPAFTDNLFAIAQKARLIEAQPRRHGADIRHGANTRRLATYAGEPRTIARTLRPDEMKWAPATTNTNPARILFLRRREASEQLQPALSPVNVDKTMSVCAGSGVRSNFRCKPGYGVPSKVMPRSPRLAFDEACKLV
jgi:hypothetical protein